MEESSLGPADSLRPWSPLPCVIPPRLNAQNTLASPVGFGASDGESQRLGDRNAQYRSQSRPPHSCLAVGLSVWTGSAGLWPEHTTYSPRQVAALCGLVGFYRTGHMVRFVTSET